ncbi:hypothetical protein D3C78_1795290 [compost metagenome]
MPAPFWNTSPTTACADMPGALRSSHGFRVMKVTPVLVRLEPDRMSKPAKLITSFTAGFLAISTSSLSIASTVRLIAAPSGRMVAEIT